VHRQQVEPHGRARLQVAQQHAHRVAILSSRHGDEDPITRLDEAVVAHGAAHVPEKAAFDVHD
jgi:hypothetical protein